jgi:hypothetical protein
MAFIAELLADVPDLRPSYLEHLDDNFGELLPHVFTCGRCRTKPNWSKRRRTTPAVLKTVFLTSATVQRCARMK